MTEIEERNAATIRRWFEDVWNQGRAEVIDELLTDDCVARGMGPNGSDLVGREPFRLAHAAYLAIFGDLHVEIEHLIARDDWVAVSFVTTARHIGDGLGLPATDRSVTFRGASFSQLRDGQLMGGTNILDLLSALQQVGAFDTSAMPA